MSTAVLRDEPAYTIEYDDEIDAVVHTWEEFTSGQEFRDGCEALLECAKQRDASKMLVDTRAIEAHDDDDQAWMQREWTPRVSRAGVDYSATVRSDSVIAEMDLENLMDDFDQDDHGVKVTADMDEARRWLAEQ